MHQCHQLHATVSEREREGGGGGGGKLFILLQKGGKQKKGGFQPLEETMGIVTGMEFLM